MLLWHIKWEHSIWEVVRPTLVKVEAGCWDQVRSYQKQFYSSNSLIHNWTLYGWTSRHGCIYSLILAYTTKWKKPPFIRQNFPQNPSKVAKYSAKLQLRYKISYRSWWCYSLIVVFFSLQVCRVHRGEPPPDWGGGDGVQSLGVQHGRRCQQWSLHWRRGGRGSLGHQPRWYSLVQWSKSKMMVSRSKCFKTIWFLYRNLISHSFIIIHYMPTLHCVQSEIHSELYMKSIF